MIANELTLRGFPTTFFNSFLIYLFILFFSLPRCVRDSTPVSNWIYALIGLLETLAIIFNQLAYQHTSIASTDLMTSFSVLVAALLSVLIFRFRYIWTHYIGIFLTLLGLVLTSISDSENGSGVSTLSGDLFALGVAIIYGTVTTLIQFTVSRGSSLSAYFGRVSLVIICVTAACFFIFSEFQIFRSSSFDWEVALFYLLLSLRSVNSLLIAGFVRRYGATMFSIASLGSVLYSMLLDVFLFDRPFKILVLLAYFLIVGGILTFQTR